MILQKREARGVYYAQHSVDGYAMLYAVKSNGDELKPRVVLRPGVDPDDAAERLWQKLDEVDPVPRLRLVRELPVERPAPPPESSTAFLMRRARQYQQEGRVRRLS